MAKILTTAFIVLISAISSILYADDIRIPLHASSVSLDPTAVQDQSSLWVSRQINCQLVRFRNGKVFKEAAANIKYDGPLKVVIDLRNDIRFSDGTPVESDDVIASFEYLSRSREILRTIFNWVKKIEKVSDNRFVFILKKPMPQFLNTLSSPNYAIFKKEFIERAINDKSLWKRPVGCGNYRISEYDEFGKHVRLVPVWEGRPVTFYFNKDNQIKAEELAKYDIVGLDIVGNTTENYGYRIERVFDPYHIFMGLNLNKNRWASKRNRCAFFNELNPKIVIEGYGDIAEYANDIIPRGVLGHSKHANYKKEMEEGALGAKFDPAGDNEPFCMAFLSVSVPQIYRDKYIKMVNSIYDDVTAKTLESPKHFGREFQKLNCDALILGLKSNTLDGYEYLLVHSEEAANILGKQDPTTIEAIKASQNIGDSNHRGYVYQDIAGKIRQECLIFPILTIPMKKVHIKENLQTPDFGTVPLNEYYLGKVK